MYSCIDCGHLDKSRKNYFNKGNQDYFQYGCNYRGPDKFICGWCSSDSNLKSSFLGCSDWKDNVVEEENQLPGQMNIMDFLGG